MKQLFFLALAAISPSLIGQINATAAQDFSVRFGTDQASWAQEGNTFVATFKSETGPAYAEYDAQGVFLGLASLSNESAMPSEAQSFLKRGFTGEDGNGPYDLQYVRLLQEENGQISYVAVLAESNNPNQHLKLYFDGSTGNLERRAIW